MKILISGAGIGGTAAARLLGRNGADVTVVENATAVRPGGQAVDFKGRTHQQLLERIGILADVQAVQTARTDWRMVDEQDRVSAVVPGEFIGGDLEVLRGDLAAILHRHSAKDAEYVFGDRIVALEERDEGVHVSFASRSSERFDLVIGADGVHSSVRRLVFGPEEEHLRGLGACYAVAGGEVDLGDLERRRPDGRAVAYGYTVPGRFALAGGQKAPNLFVFRAGRADPHRADVTAQKAMLADAFSGIGWRVPEMIAAAADAPDFYLDALVRTTMSSFTRGRIALVGDAGYANTLGGFGTGLALLGAYILAGELVASGGELTEALRAYDRRMKGPTAITRKGSAAGFLAPTSRLRIRMRDWSFANPLMLRLMMRMTDVVATEETLPDYRLH